MIKLFDNTEALIFKQPHGTCNGCGIISSE
jgi:hypothetical protein